MVVQGIDVLTERFESWGNLAVVTEEVEIEKRGTQYDCNWCSSGCGGCAGCGDSGYLLEKTPTPIRPAIVSKTGETVDVRASYGCQGCSACNGCNSCE